MQNFRRNFNLIMALMMVLNGPVASALQLRVKERVNVRSGRLSSSKYMTVTGSLNAGSIVDIPDNFVVTNPRTQKPDVERSLMNWLNQSSQVASVAAPGSYQMESGKYDYFFPVKVVQASKGSQVPQDETVFIALISLAQKKNYLEVVVDSPVYTAVAEQPKAQTEADLQLTCSNCQSADPFAAIVEFLPKTMSRFSNLLQNKSENLVENLQNAQRSFESSCNDERKTKTYSEFLDIIQDEAKNDGELTMLLINKMALESEAKCFGYRQETNGTASLGLFQINSGSTQVKQCSAAEITAIKRASFAELRSGPKCISNPIINVRESIKILKEKEQTLFAPGLFDKGKMTPEDRLMFIAAAYNGGETYVLKAREDLIAFEKYQKSIGNNYDYNPDSWNDVKTFFFRDFLSANEQVQAFGAYKNRRARALALAVLNVAHAEALGGSVASTTLSSL